MGLVWLKFAVVPLKCRRIKFPSHQCMTACWKAGRNLNGLSFRNSSQLSSISLEIVYLIIKPSYFFLDKHCTSNLIVQFTLKCKCYYLLWGLFSRVEWQFLYFCIWVSQRDLQWPRRGHRDHQYWPCLDLEIRPKYWKRVCNQSNHLKII